MSDQSDRNYMRIEFEVTAQKLADSMALAAREAPDAAGLPNGLNFTTESPLLAAFVERTPRRQALETLRNDFRAYGELCFPDDLPPKAWRRAYDMARDWGYR